MNMSKFGNEFVQNIRRSLSSHERWRKDTLNLIASENVHSPLVDSLIRSDLMGRYASYTDRDLQYRKYCGGRYIVEIEVQVNELARQVFNARYVELRAISGHMAGMAVLLGLCKPGDVVLELDRSGGGHRLAERISLAELLNIEVHFIPFDGSIYNVDIPATCELIRKCKPRVVILGSSSFLFPHPVAKIKQVMLETTEQSILVYDASHVMGFLASGKFQDPLQEGADVVFGSTHKTLPGPQGGIIFSNNEELIKSISEAVYPVLVTNHHVFRMPALGAALAEMEYFGEAYTDQIVNNSQALGQALEQRGIPCIKVKGKYSLSHTVLAGVAEFGRGVEIAHKLEDANIITGRTTLPEIYGSEGIRLGVQEITHLGAGEKDMDRVAGFIAAVLKSEKQTQEIRAEVIEFTDSLGPVRYTW